jgi:tRNA-specific 2-thiouridylase
MKKESKKRVVVAMSGGVDSSTAAWLLKERGYEVIGATMCIGVMEREPGGPIRCCSLTDIEDARRVALKIGIPFNVFYFREEFEKEVIQYFCKEYEQGRTPNPCIICNEKIKFGIFLKKAFEMGADYIATGHYARLEYNKIINGYVLRRGIDKKKDQSYVLFSIKKEQFPYILFPLGDLKKDEVRRKAFEIGLQVYNKRESQEVCFIQDRTYHTLLSERLRRSIKPGPIMDKNGNVLGTHKGIAYYTIGQRRGLRIAKGKPLYVIRIDRENNAIIVGDMDDVFGERFIVNSINWIVPGDIPETFGAHVKIRYNHPGAEATIYRRGENKVEVVFKSPQKAITPGQAAVFYDEDKVLGGGWIKEVIY